MEQTMGDPKWQSHVTMSQLFLSRAKVTSESQELQNVDPSCQCFYRHSIFLVTVINYEKGVNH